jgi:hypothetical protein
VILVFRIPPLDWILVRLPPIDRMTLPRFVALVPWSLAICAGLATEGVVRGRLRSMLWRWAPAAVLLEVALWAAPWNLSGPSCARVGLTVVLAAGVAAAVRYRKWLAPAVALELAILGFGINPVADPRDRLPRPALLHQLGQLVQQQGGRVIGLHQALGPNTASRYGLSDLRASDPLRPQPYSRMMAQLGEPEPVLGRLISSAPTRLCGAWSVRFLVTPPSAEAPGWEQVWSDDSGTIWHNPHWLPEIRLLGQVVHAAENAGWTLIAEQAVDLTTTAVIPAAAPRVKAEQMAIEHLLASPTRITAEVVCDGPCLLAIARPWAPGWQAAVDDQPVPVIRANLAGLGAIAPAGRHRITLHYNPWSWF